MSLALLFLDESSRPTGGVAAPPVTYVEPLGPKVGIVRPNAGDFNMPHGGIIAAILGKLAWA